ncbi:MAG: VOC family protein [Bryobacteraceae bacterium]
MKIGAIVIRCYEFEKMLAFWLEALHYVPRAPAKGGWVVLRDPAGRGPNVSLDQYPERRKGKRSRLHLGPLHERSAKRSRTPALIGSHAVSLEI